MPKTRLNAEMRNKLTAHARTLVRCPEEAAAAAAAKKALTSVTDALATQRFPEREMVVLLKYDAVHSVDQLETKKVDAKGCVHLPLSKQFHLPYNPRFSSCHYAIELPFDHPVWGLQIAYEAACRAYKEAKSAKLRDYNTLIDSCRNYEDVEEVWPEAALIKDTLGVRAVYAMTALSDDTIARIKVDVASRIGAPVPIEPAAE